MTAEQVPAIPVMVQETNPDRGCNRCGTQDTVLLHPHHGRQCPQHITLPPGPYRPDLAEHMVELRHADAAWSYLGAYLAREADLRFLRARISLALASETAGEVSR